MKTATLLLLFAASILSAARSETKSTTTLQVQALRLNETIAVDGVLSEAVWQNGGGISQFKQRDPNENAEPTEKTIVHVAYDDAALYVAARMFDSAPDSIIARLGRRDAQLTSDMFGFFVDPYYDRRSGFYFSLNAAGTMYDGVLYNDEWDDNSWDGVWEGKAKIDAHGWTAEMRIPYSQLRFQKKEQLVWGVNFRRDIARRNERNYLVFTPKNGSGFVSRFVDLVGIENIAPPRRIEALPYVIAKAEYLPHGPDDPFNDGSNYTPGAGADFKIGLGNNLTLDATVNPDFGQVEVDPAVVNLSDVETFFQEKRPFFIEGSTIFEFGNGGSRSNWGFNWGNPSFFYSRRIGRAPQGSVPDADYASAPLGTTILGAAKLTGKVGNNWNVGTLHAVTAREHAKLQNAGQTSRSEVEPMTYYGIARAQKEMHGGRQGLGFLSTFSKANFADDRLRDEINSSALGFGIDGWTFLDSSQTWVLNGWTGISQMRGNPTRMLALQRSYRHYYQRPDAGHVEVDSTATSLSGYAGRIALNKQKGNVMFNTAFGFIDPGFDVNDMGFQWRNDVLNAHIAGGYKWTKPGKVFRSAQMLGALFQSNDFEGNKIWQGVWQSGFFEFLNYYSLQYNFAYNPQTVSNRRTRGGPLTLNPPGWEVGLFASSDSRKAWVMSFNSFAYTRPNYGGEKNLGLSLEWKPAANVSVSLNPSVYWNREFAQYVEELDDPLATATFGKRYVFAELNQTEFSAGIRLNWTFTPRLSLQFYGQPLISSGDYHDYKQLARPKSYDFLPYATDRSDDFNFKSLRGNAVLRWEYFPGSTLYFVWTQSRSDYENLGEFQFNHSVDRLVDTRPENIFLLKASYWLGL
ncbi:carbohydrate binding family 9 domain-containing protein [candidate division KSB1 bacterium]|nr:carbohydrate binding family 9 domain-containing protein [candidate division KSB1 bacterium]